MSGAKGKVKKPSRRFEKPSFEKPSFVNHPVSTHATHFTKHVCADVHTPDAVRDRARESGQSQETSKKRPERVAGRSVLPRERAVHRLGEPRAATLAQFAVAATHCDERKERSGEDGGNGKEGTRIPVTAHDAGLRTDAPRLLMAREPAKISWRDGSPTAGVGEMSGGAAG
ncbi:hypothetical protein MTO96_023290 [Rhipicephalus appendiculatus]